MSVELHLQHPHLTRHPSLMMPEYLTTASAAYPLDVVEPFPHAMTEWRER